MIRHVVIRQVILLVLIAFSGQPLAADMGRPTVQAVARVTLRDGEVVTGYLQLTAGGYGRHAATHGFLFKGRTRTGQVQESPLLFTLEMVWIDFESGQWGRRDGGTSSSPAWANAEVRFLREATDLGKERRETVRAEGDPPLLTRRLVRETVYEVHDALPVYTVLPEPVYLYAEENYGLEPPTNLRWIPLEKLRRLELLDAPADRWRQEIAARTQAFDGRFGNCDDCVLQVVWYHELWAPDADGQWRDDVAGSFKPWDE